MRVCLCHWRCGGCVSVQVVTGHCRRSHFLWNIGNVLFDLADEGTVILWNADDYLPRITVSYLSRLESSRACLFNTVSGINCASVVYQYLYVASNAADGIVYVEDSWLGVWWKMVGMLKSCRLWRTKILSHIKPVHTHTLYNFKIHIITAFLCIARFPKWSVSPFNFSK